MSRFRVEFYCDAAAKEYRRLDGSVKQLVNVGLRKLEERADEIGKPLLGALAGCKELKFRKLGIRVIFRIVNNIVEVVEIIAVGSREDGEVFDLAVDRIRQQ